ncbi:MAG: hypothetical protein IKB94_05740 [Clostridia bacterium]|nr:hypothetical protein [Clostridia bacterium]
MIFFKNTQTDSETVVFEALEGEKSIGKCTLVLRDNLADVTVLSYDESAPYAVEGLLRSAYNYAGLKNYYMARCSARNIDSFLDRMNFKKADDGYTGDIPSILMGSCCK